MRLWANKVNPQLSVTSVSRRFTFAALAPVEVSEGGEETDRTERVLGEYWFLSAEQM